MARQPGRFAVYKLRAEKVGSDIDARAFHNFRKVLDRKDVDAVVICTPDHWHALPAILACQAGKDLYCEKPLALTIREGRAMVAAARKYDRVFAVGTQQRSLRPNEIACKLVRSGAMGRVHRVVVANNWSPSGEHYRHIYHLLHRASRSRRRSPLPPFRVIGS